MLRQNLRRNLRRNLVPDVQVLLISSAGCGSSKVCFSQPADCDPAGGSQCRFMSARLLSPGGPAVRYEVTGAADGYVAFGFSDDQKMGNDDIYICGLDSKGSVGVTHAFSTGPTFPEVQPLGNVVDVQASVQNGVLSCSFTSSNPISTQRSSNLSSLYYLLFAYGASSSGKIQMHKDTFTSSQRVDISAPAVVQSDGKVNIIRAHGALMLIAWMTTGPLGMMVARFLKSMGRGVKPCGKDLWFVVHVSVMTVTVAATIIAFILAFSFVNGWAEGAHPVLGVLVMILALIQPILALMRCGPQHPCGGHIYGRADDGQHPQRLAGESDGGVRRLAGSVLRPDGAQSQVEVERRRAEPSCCIKYGWSCWAAAAALHPGQPLLFGRSAGWNRTNVIHLER
uniref:Putative ferric-chelate reductase 1 n=1 Tax=Fundulus heteroclitus TaxID=8078 RepID=A0A3Q2NNQ8_FUNHE